LYQLIRPVRPHRFRDPLGPFRLPHPLKETSVNLGLTVTALILGGSAVVAGHALTGLSSSGGTRTGGVAAVGPDVIVGAIPDVARYAPGTYLGTEWASYAFGSTSCNIGDQQLLWQPNPSPNHPVIPQNLYRIKDGVIEMIGMSWVKHGFCALQQTLCGPCQPAGGGCPTVLGIGCSDPYTASLNGAQGDLKSRGPINAATGAFSGNYADPVAPSGLPTSLRERVMVARNDLNPALNTGATYYAECQYIHPQDAAAGNALNNASYRKLTVGATWSTSLGYPMTLTGPTVQQKPAIFAWQAEFPDVKLVPVDVPGDGRFIVGSRAIDQGDGTWRYEYAIFNLNSDRSAGSFSVALPNGASVVSTGFKGPKYLNGESYSNADWEAVTQDGQVRWACESNANPNANALRWSTMYNYRFVSDAPPTESNASLGLFKAGTAGAPDAMQVVVVGPSSVVAPCPADLSGDGVVNAADLSQVLGFWGLPNADIDGDGTTGASDLSIVLGAWGPCP